MLSSRIASPAARRAAPHQQRTFLTSRALLDSSKTGATAGQNPSYPRFSLRRISPNPRVRLLLAAGFVGLAGLETAAWVQFGPKILGKKSDEAEQ